jgi:UPF0042 nucleotide-binding protein
MSGAPVDAARELVVVVGMSGAGRSTTLAALQDLGFYCVDSLPPEAFESALSACDHGGVPRVALGLDTRVQPFLDEAVGAIERLGTRRNLTLLFLDASDAALLARFSATRRPHPLETLGNAEVGSSLAIVDGISLERQRLAELRSVASLVIDTTELTVHDLRRRIIDLFRPRVGGRAGLATRLVSFGFKHGVPSDCDTVFDVRFVTNPYFVPELKPQSGLDEAVVAFVKNEARAAAFFEQTVALLALLLPWYQEEGKSHFTVGFGCTGGRHRSVVMAEWVAEALRSKGLGPIEVAHRDLARFEAESGRSPAAPRR